MANDSSKTGASYRDDLRAAQARADSLEARLSAANARIAELEKPKVAKPARERSRVAFDGNATYFPLFRLWLDGMRTAARRIPSLPKKEFGSIIAAALYWLVSGPLLQIFRVIYVVHLYALVAPWTLFLSALLSVPAVLVIFLGSFRFADAPPPKRRWLSGRGNGSSYLWLLLCFAGWPLLPLFAPGYDGT